MSNESLDSFSFKESSTTSLINADEVIRLRAVPSSADCLKKFILSRTQLP